MIDLHIHTNASDGEFTADNIIRLALDKKLSAIAITDHDTVQGIKASKLFKVQNEKLKIICGIEISCYESIVEEVHVLGLFIDYNNSELSEFLEKIRLERITQKKRIIKMLNKLGYEMKFEDVQDIGNVSIGRPHIAMALKKRYSEFDSVGDVFDKLIGYGKPAYVDRKNKTKLKDAIKIIRKAGGVSFLAHPGGYRKDVCLNLIKFFKENKGNGIETFYPYNKIFPQLELTSKDNEKLISSFRTIAKKEGLLECGGSDFHGKIRDCEIGELKIGDEIYEQIRQAKEKRFSEGKDE